MSFNFTYPPRTRLGYRAGSRLAANVCEDVGTESRTEEAWRAPTCYWH